MDGLQRHFRGDLSDISWHEPQPGEPTRGDLDLRAMARRAMNYFLRTPRPELDYACRFNNGLLACPPGPQGEDLVAHGDTDVRQETALIGLRELSGVTADTHVDEGLHRRVMSYVGEEGLSYVPYAMACAGDMPPETVVGTLWTTGWTIRSLTDHHVHTGEAAFADQARRMAHRLLELAHWDTGRAFYPGTMLLDGRWIGGVFGADANFYCPIVCDLVHYAETLGDELIFDLAHALARGIAAGLPGEDKLGDRLIRDDGRFSDHTHLHTRVIWGVAAAGRAAEDPALIEWARRAYEFVRSCGTDYGWFPERIILPGEHPYDRYEHRVDVSETCVTGDMTQTAVELARAGYPHYWDHVERYVRNYLHEVQFVITPAIEAYWRAQHTDRPAAEVDRGFAILGDFDGGFMSDIGVNDWRGPEMFFCQAGCCVPEAARALVTAWSHTLSAEDDQLCVNMALGHDDESADVVVTDAGLTVTPKTDGPVLVRPPAWTRRGEVRALRQGQPIDVSWSGDYIRFDDARAGQPLAVRWPVPRFQQRIEVGGRTDSQHPYTITWQGNTATAIDPPGDEFPMFGSK